jgi:hypothetical protein
MSTPTSTAPTSDETLRCARHPSVETVLRCGRCDTPICPRCLVPTPVGARCPTCAQVKRFAFLVKPRELALSILYGVGIGTIGTIIVTFIPFLGLLGYMLMGFLVGEGVSIGANRKRARELGFVAVGCVFVGYYVGVIAPQLQRGFDPAVLLVPLLILRINVLLLVGLLVGALLAWMRVR